MDFPNSYIIRRPVYCYSTDCSRRLADKHRGLLQYGPLQPAKISTPRFLFIFPEQEREIANHLFLSLKNGVHRFPGTKSVIGLSVEKDSVEPLRIPRSGYDTDLKLFKLITDRLERDERPDFAFILHDKQPNPLIDDPYPSAKAACLRYGIPSQFISLELLRNTSQFQFAISNIALSVFVKLGGIPWSVSLKRAKPTLVFGIGKAEIQTKSTERKRRLIGYATCVLSNGLYLKTTFFPPAESYDQFITSLKQGLASALTQMLSRENDYGGVDKVSIHISQLEKEDTVRAVRETVETFKSNSLGDIPIEVVKVTDDSDFSVLDLNDSGYVSEEGSVISLGQDHALLVTEGRKEKSVWRGRKPVTLELRRTYKSTTSLNMRETIEDAFWLSSVNWRGFNATTQPVSLQYAKLLADQIAKTMVVEPDICKYIEQHPALSDVPWFI